MRGLLNHAFALHYQQMVERKLAAMSDEDWHALEESMRLNDEWAEYSPAVFARTGPTRFECPVGVVAGPLGFYGSVCKVFLGPCRDTREEALSDAVDAASMMETGGHAGLIEAYWRAHNGR